MTRTDPKRMTLECAERTGEGAALSAFDDSTAHFLDAVVAQRRAMWSALNAATSNRSDVIPAALRACDHKVAMLAPAVAFLALGEDCYPVTYGDAAECSCWPCQSYYGRMMARARRIVDATAGDSVSPVFVAAYGIDRCYGGPEEGGWYYDMQRVLEVRRTFGGWKGALRLVRALREEYPTCPRGRYSVIGGTDVEIRVHASANDIPDDDTDIPRYE